MTVDPFTIEVIRHGLSAAAEEMSLTVMRSARSPLLREAGDLSSAMTDHQGELISQGKDIPAHIGTMSYTVKDFIAWISVDRLQPGDVWFTNHPECGGNHLPDMKAIRPIFHSERLIAFSVSLAHWADVGGAWPGSYFAAAMDSIQEGLRLPPLRLFTAEGPDREKMDVVLCNVRGGNLVEGDIFAQMAATRAAEVRLHELCDEHGLETIVEAMRRLHDLSEAEMREAIDALPDGIYKARTSSTTGDPMTDRLPCVSRSPLRRRGDVRFQTSDDAVTTC